MFVRVNLFMKTPATNVKLMTVKHTPSRTYEQLSKIKKSDKAIWKRWFSYTHDTDGHGVL